MALIEIPEISNYLRFQNLEDLISAFGHVVYQNYYFGFFFLSASLMGLSSMESSCMLSYILNPEFIERTLVYGRNTRDYQNITDAAWLIASKHLSHVFVVGQRGDDRFSG